MYLDHIHFPYHLISPPTPTDVMSPFQYPPSTVLPILCIVKWVSLELLELGWELVYRSVGTLTGATAVKKISLPLSFIAYKSWGVSPSPFLDKLMICPVFIIFPLSFINQLTDTCLAPITRLFSTMLNLARECWCSSILFHFICSLGTTW